MAHNVETMAYAGETPWHGLGVKVDESIGVDGMLEAAGLNWTVSKAPTFYRVGDKEVATGKFVLFAIQIRSFFLTYLLDGSLVRTLKRLTSSKSL